MAEERRTIAEVRAFVEGAKYARGLDGSVGRGDNPGAQTELEQGYEVCLDHLINFLDPIEEADRG